LKYLRLLAFLAAMMLLSGCRRNQAPYQAAVPSGPSSGLPDDLLAFRSSASDPDDDSVAIRFDWGDGDTSAWRLTARGIPVADSHSWTASDTYLVRAQARDAREVRSEWSDPHSLAIVHTPPELWLSGARNLVADDTFKLDVTLFAAEGESAAVRVSWGDGDTTGWSEFFPSDDYTRLLHQFGDTGNYLVTAQAKDTRGFTSDWSESCSVFVWRPKWRYATGGNVEGCPAVAADGTVYFGSYDAYLYALDPYGNLKWRYATGGGIWSSPALAADGTVYIASDSCLYAVGSNGVLKWSYKIGSVTSSPAIGADGTVYIGSCDSCLYAIDPAGVLRWRYAVDWIVASSPAIAADGTVYFGAGLDSSGLYAIKPDGTLKWRCSTGYIYGSSPAIAADGTVYIVATDGYLYAIRPDGTLRWRHGGARFDCSSPVIAADGMVCVGSDSGLLAIDETGVLKWDYCDKYAAVSSSPALAADGAVYFGSQNACLYAVLNGALQWRYQIGTSLSRGANPAIAADGTVYAGSEDGYLYAIEGDSPLADSPWPKFHHDARNTGRVGGGR